MIRYTRNTSSRHDSRLLIHKITEIEDLVFKEVELIKNNGGK